MADRGAVDAILDRVLAAPAGSAARGRSIVELISLLDAGGDLKAWSGDFIQGAPDRRDAADEYRAIAMESIFSALISMADLRAENRIGVVYQIVRRQVMRHVSFRETGFAGLKYLAQRTRRYRRIRDELTEANGVVPGAEEIFGAAEAEDARSAAEAEDARSAAEAEDARSAAEAEDARSAPKASQPKLLRTEAAIYARGGRIRTTELSARSLTLQREDVAEEAVPTLESIRIVRTVVDSIVTTYREQTGLLWYAMVVAEARQRATGADDIPKIARRAGITLVQAMKYRAIVAEHPRLDTAISSGADGHILEVALDEAPQELGFVTWTRALLRAVLDAAPGEAGLLTYAHSWLMLAADLGRKPSSSELVRAVEERTGVRLSERRVRGYSRALTGVLDEIRAAEAALPV